MFIRNSFVFEFSFDKLRDGGCICITPLKLNKQFKLIHQLSLYTSSQDFCGKLNGYIKYKNLYASFLFLFGFHTHNMSVSKQLLHQATEARRCKAEYWWKDERWFDTGTLKHFNTHRRIFLSVCHIESICKSLVHLVI